jgi:hypothetical protein
MPYRVILTDAIPPTHHIELSFCSHTRVGCSQSLETYFAFQSVTLSFSVLRVVTVILHVMRGGIKRSNAAVAIPLYQSQSIPVNMQCLSTLLHWLSQQLCLAICIYAVVPCAVILHAAKLHLLHAGQLHNCKDIPAVIAHCLVAHKSVTLW